MYSDFWNLPTSVREARRLHRLKTLKVGDEVVVKVSEEDSPWINGPWRGHITAIDDNDGSLHVRPLSWRHDWRVKPSPQYFNQGLYLTLADNVEQER